MAKADDRTTLNREALQVALLPRYALQSEIGRGSTATVYLAEDLKHRRQVAIKVLRPEVAQAVGSDRFLREIRIAARLSHPAIVPVHDSGQAGGTLYYVMPFVEGESLRSRLDREGPLPLGDVVTIAQQIGNALDYAHALQIVHRDLKPANILLTHGGAVIGDFGVARAITQTREVSLTETGLAVGTPLYMSPEQAVGGMDIDRRSDVYSLGVVVYEALTGEAPFSNSNSRAVLARKLSDSIPPLRSVRDSVAPATEAAVMRALARVPADRYDSAGEFATALEKAHASVRVSARNKYAGRRLRIGGWVAAAMVAAAGLLLAWRGWTQYSNQNPVGPAWVLMASTVGSAPADVRASVTSILMGAVDRSGILVTVPQSQVRLGLRSMVREDTTSVTEDIALEVAQRGSIPLVIIPSLDRIGRRFVLTLRAHEADSGSLLETMQVAATTEDELLSATWIAADRLTTSLRIPDPGRPMRRPPPITPSFAAFDHWATGSRLLETAERRVAAASFQEAVRLDPQFAAAWCWLAQEHSVNGRMEAADSAFARAFASDGRLTEFDQVMCRAIHAAHRRDYDEALLLTTRMIAQFGVGQSNRAVALALLGRHSEAIAALGSAWVTYPFGPPDREVLAMAGWLIDVRELERAEEMLESVPVSEARQQWEARLAMASGRWARVVELTEGPIGHLPISATMRLEIQAIRGRLSSIFRDLDEQVTTPAAARALGLLDAHEIMLLLTLVSGNHGDIPDPTVLVGDTAERSRLLRGLWSSQRGDHEAVRAALQSTLSVANRRPRTARHWSDLCRRRVLEAREAVHSGNFASAVNLVRSSGCRQYDGNGRLYLMSEWVVADAFERNGQSDSAAFRFAAIANRELPARPFYTPYGLAQSFAHYRAAHLFSRIGDRGRAVYHWRRLLADMSDPDPDLLWMRDQASGQLPGIRNRPIRTLMPTFRPIPP